LSFAKMTQPTVTRTERVDDIPLLIVQMEKMQIAELMDKHFPAHGNWSGMGFGQTVVGWLAYILSEGDHRLNHVQGWAAGLLLTLGICLKSTILRDLDFSDDRLATILTRLGNDAEWEGYEIEQAQVLLRVYDLKSRQVRIDSTTAKSYVGVSEDGLFQFGHSKEHRPDLPQLKISQAVLDPLGLPLTTTIVSGESADDPLYLPEIRKVQAIYPERGLLYVGDCKMGAIETRAYLAHGGDYYLLPLSTTHLPTETLRTLLLPVWAEEQALTPIYRPQEKEGEAPECIAEGFRIKVKLTATVGGEEIEWDEYRSVIRSFKYAEAQERALEAHLKKAEKAIAALNSRGQGIKRLDEAELRDAVNQILQQHDVAGLLNITYAVDSRDVSKRAYKDRPAQTTTIVTVTVETRRNANAYAEVVRSLGWRVYACNDADLTLTEVVLAYRDQYIVERGFNRFRGKVLGLTPIYLGSTTRIKGLVRLLTIGLRVLCLVEFEVRRTLQEQNEKLVGIHAGNPKRATTRPTTEMMLKAFLGITLSMVAIDGVEHGFMTPLNAVQQNILRLVGFPADIYQTVQLQSVEVSTKMGER
jgi:transposase